jgi:hypothetical protein
MRKYQIWLLFAIVPVILYSSVTVQAQGTSPWAPSQLIPLYTEIYPPILVADQNRTVHAFNSELQADEKMAIFYRRWNIDQGWTTPVDIQLVYPSSRDALQGVVLDPAGRFHMAYFSGVLEARGNILYTRAWASQADQSQAWEAPSDIGMNAGPLLSADLALFGDNHLALVYSGKEDGVGLYETHSDDGGDTWTEPVRITPPYEEGLLPVHIQMEFDEEGRLHVVWGVVDESGVGQRVYYTRREVDEVTWRNPYLLAAAEGNDYGADWPSIIDYQGQLIVLYMDGTIPNGVPPTRWMRISKDSGNTWSAPVQPFPQVGENGIAVLLVDSNGMLHTVLANRIEDPPAAGAWHGIWIGDQWSDLELITSRSAIGSSSSGADTDAFAASRPNAVIVQGNVLLSAWWHDMRNPPVAGYSYARINGPEYPIIPLPEVTPTSTPLPPPTVSVATVTPTVYLPPPGSSGGSPDQPLALSITTSLIIGIMPVLLLVAIVVGFQRIRSPRTHR